MVGRAVLRPNCAQIWNCRYGGRRGRKEYGKLSGIHRILLICSGDSEEGGRDDRSDQEHFGFGRIEELQLDTSGTQLAGAHYVPDTAEAGLHLVFRSSKQGDNTPMIT